MEKAQKKLREVHVRQETRMYEKGADRMMKATKQVRHTHTSTDRPTERKTNSGK